MYVGACDACIVCIASRSVGPVGAKVFGTKLVGLVDRVLEWNTLTKAASRSAPRVSGATALIAVAGPAAIFSCSAASGLRAGV